MRIGVLRPLKNQPSFYHWTANLHVCARPSATLLLDNQQMSPSLASSDIHGGHSNTSSASDAQRPHHTCDAPPMITTSHFESAVVASGQDVLSSPCREPSMCAIPQLPAHWSRLASPLARSVSSEYLHGLAVSLADERTAPSATGISSFHSNLAAPIPAYGLVGSPFDLSRSPSIHSNSQNDLSTLDGHQSAYAAFLLTRSRAVKVSFLL